jgi:hypothetical protein
MDLLNRGHMLANVSAREAHGSALAGLIRQAEIGEV